MSRSGQTALIIVVPEAEDLVGAWRLRHDPSAAYGAPAHVTLLYPFRPAPSIDTALRDELGELFAARPAFAFRLAEVREFPDVLYLAPDPYLPFERLTADLAARFPDTPSYAGEIDHPIPHLTVACAEPPELPAVACAFRAVAAAALPIDCVAREVTLLVNIAERWETCGRFPLREH